MAVPLHARSLSLPRRLSDVTCSFAPGRVTAICGPNGAGKSSLLGCLAGLLPRAGGSVALGERDLADIPAMERARLLGYLPQEAEIAWNLSVEALVALGRLPHRDAAPDKVSAALEAVALTGFAQRRVATLSGGEKARALLARVLAGEPQWILADETLAALDLAHARGLIAHLRQAARSGAGVVLVLHDLSLAMNHADEVLVLDRGRLHEKGPPEAALSQGVIADVWGVSARWLGEPGARALSLR